MGSGGDGALGTGESQAAPEDGRSGGGAGAGAGSSSSLKMLSPGTGSLNEHATFSPKVDMMKNVQCSIEGNRLVLPVVQ